MTNPLTRQVAGSHYVKLGMQPVVFATANLYDPCAFSILKYITRWRDKNGLQDLQKALHFAELRQAVNVDRYLINHPWNKVFTGPISIHTYTRVNNLPKTECDILLWLDRWVYSDRGGRHGLGMKDASENVVRLLQQLITENGG